MRKVILLVFAMVFAGCLFCPANEKQPSQNLKEDKGCCSENWKEYESLVEMWPQLKEEGIESIRLRYTISLEYGYDTTGDFEENVNEFGYRERVAEVIKWWPTIYKVPKGKLPECIEVIDKSVKNAGGPYKSVGALFKILIVTGRGNYIFLSPREKCVSDALDKFFAKYCKPSHEHWYALPPKEQTAAIAIFSPRDCGKSSKGSMIVWPPIALFGDKKEAEKLLGRSFEPRMVLEGREWLGKMIDEYEVAMRDAEEERWREENDHPCKGYIVFLTQDEFYWKEIGVYGNPVFGRYITESQQLKEYFDEIGLTEELLAGETEDTKK